MRYQDGRFRVAYPGGEVLGDRLLVATGRAANTAGLGLEAAGVATDARGAVRVDERLRTSAPHVFAAGDFTTLPELVYVAAAAGTRAAVNMTGGEARLDLTSMPAVVFTDSQAAWVGATEEAARQQGLAVESRTLALEHVPRALVNFEARGFVKLVAEVGSGRLLGAQVLAPGAGEVIQSAALAPVTGHYSSAARARRKEAEATTESSSPATPPDDQATASPEERRRLRRQWARLIRRIYEADPLLCECGHEMRVISFLTDPLVVDKILRHLERKGSLESQRGPPGAPVHLAS